MALANRNDIRFRYNATSNSYSVYANFIVEESVSGTYKFHPNYQISCYELVETSETLTGVRVSSNGTITCNEFIEGEPT